MQSKDFFERLRRFDAYPKTLEDFRVKTFTGATVTIISGLLMFVLFVSELNYYLTKEVRPELYVDTSRGQLKLRINFNVTFSHVACAFLSIDAMDVSGENQIDLDHNVFKQRLTLTGEFVNDNPEKQDIGDDSKEIVDAVKTELDPDRCESCYGAENEEQKGITGLNSHLQEAKYVDEGQTRCCNSCEDVREAYRKKGWAFKTSESIEQCKREGWSDKIKSQMNEGCMMFGYIEVNKVAGNFHFAPGKSFQQSHVHVHDLQAFGGEKFNTSHTIHQLSFGEEYPGIVNPLDRNVEIADKSQMMFQYFVKIVPTTYTSNSGKTVFTNQFSVTKHSKMVTGTGDSGLPGIFVMYELSPMMVKYTEKHRSFMHFLTGVCAIIGGIFTVAGLIDSMIYHSARVLQKKIELGKAT